MDANAIPQGIEPSVITYPEILMESVREAQEKAVASGAIPVPTLEGFDSFELIGRGGMACVWKARQISLDRVVAIKILNSDSSKTDEDIDRFQSEARAAARMSHPGIVQVFDAFYRDGQFCLVMEYVNGYTLGSWIRQRGYLHEKEVLPIVYGVAKALQYAWDVQKLVHCDLKPDNIMIDISGTVKVADFGLARSVFSLSSRHPTSEGDYIFGTPSYMPPEQATGAPTLTVQTDMYALGATIFHTCTGRRMFESLPIDDVLNAQVKEQEEDPAVLNSELSIPFCNFLERLLAKSRLDRYSSWEDVMTSVTRIHSGQQPLRGLLDLSQAESSVKRSEFRMPAAPEQKSAKPKAKKLKKELVEAAHHIKENETAELKSLAKNKKLMLRYGGIALLLLMLAGAGINSERKMRNDRIRKELGAELNVIAKMPKTTEFHLDEALEKTDEFLQNPCLEDFPELRESADRLRERIYDSHKAHLKKQLEQLRNEAHALVSRDSWGAAAKLYSNYRGDYAKESKDYRESIALKLQNGNKTVLSLAISDPVLEKILHSRLPSAY